MKKFIKIILGTILATSVLAGCGAGTETTTNINQNTETTISGNIRMNGSTSMEKLATAMNESFMLKYPEVVATAEFTGSGAGIEAVTNGTVEIGNSSRSLKAEEVEKGITENIVAIDGIAVVTEKTNTVEDLSKEQLIGIYQGEIKNWKEVGGSDMNIVVIGREAGSGTRGAFEELLKIEDKCNYAQEIDSTGAVMAKVSATPGAIGYVSFDVIDDSIKTFKLDGITASSENIKDGKYFLCRPFVMATKGKIEEQSDAVKEYFKFINSEEGQSIIKKVGLISAK